jgi:hypothetical protein
MIISVLQADVRRMNGSIAEFQSGPGANTDAGPNTDAVADADADAGASPPNPH